MSAERRFAGDMWSLARKGTASVAWRHAMPRATRRPVERWRAERPREPNSRERAHEALRDSMTLEIEGLRPAISTGPSISYRRAALAPRA